jgi:hypothetical protein
MGGRLYDPRAGRFTSPDPIIERTRVPDDFNRYTYVGNNPLGRTDPTGLCDTYCVLWPPFDSESPSEPAPGWPIIPGSGSGSTLPPQVTPVFSLVSYAVGGDNVGTGDSGAWRATACEGSKVHCAISAWYQLKNPVHGYTNQPIASIAAAHGKTVPAKSGNRYYVRPDLFNAQNGGTYEIKSLWMYLTAYPAVIAKVDWYIERLREVGFKNAARGLQRLPGTWGEVLVDGQRYAFGSVEPGVVFYWPFVQLEGESTWQQAADRALVTIWVAAFRFLMSMEAVAPAAEAAPPMAPGEVRPAAGWLPFIWIPDQYNHMHEQLQPNLMDPA